MCTSLFGVAAQLKQSLLLFSTLLILQGLVTILLAALHAILFYIYALSCLRHNLFDALALHIAAIGIISLLLFSFT